MHNNKRGLGDLDRRGSFLEVLEQRQLLNASDDLKNVDDQLDGVTKVAGFSDLSSGALLGFNEVCEAGENNTEVSLNLGMIASGAISGKIFDITKYALKKTLQAAETAFEDNAFVQAEGAALKDGEFPFNKGWLMSATISSTSEFFVGQLSSNDEGKDENGISRAFDYVVNLAFGLTGLFIMQHASATTSVKYEVSVLGRVEEITTKPFTGWFVGGSVLGSTIAMIPQLVGHWQRGEIIEVSPVMKAIKYDWEMQHQHVKEGQHILHDRGEAMNNYYQGTSSFDFKQLHYSKYEPVSMRGAVEGVVETIPVVNVMKLSALAGEVISIGLMGMMENRAHEEGGVLVKVNDAPSYYKFAFNVQYFKNYLGLLFFSKVADGFRSQYTGEELKQHSLGGGLIREVGEFGYMTSVYFGSIRSFYPTDQVTTGMTYQMKYFRALGVHRVGVMFNDGMNRLADWYEGA